MRSCYSAYPCPVVYPASVDNSGSGILHIRSQSPAQSLRMVMPLVSAGSVDPGWTSFVAATWTNVWAIDNDYYLDYEMLYTRATIAYGFNESLGVAVGFDNSPDFGVHLGWGLSVLRAQ